MEPVDRFYRAYSRYLQTYDADSLFVLLNSLHSLGDKLKRDNDINLLEIDEFIVLKVIRNYLHHQDELKNKFISVPAREIGPIVTDLGIMCLVLKSDLKEAIEGVTAKYREKQRAVIQRSVHYYGEVVNIAHVIFNMAAKLTVVLSENNISGLSPEYEENYNCMMFDIENGHSITVSGVIRSHVNGFGEIESILLEAMRN